MIFNKDSNGAAEVKELLGFIYKANKFDNLKTYIQLAERDIKRVIGNEVYALAEEHYNSDDYKSENPTNQQLLLDELVSKIQLPVIIHAYRRYAPLNDVSHSEAGRQITVTEELKPAFSWQIENDNRNLLDIAHETTDVLLEFLDAQPENILEDDDEGHGAPIAEVENTIFKAWKTSQAYAEGKDLFITSAVAFDKIFPINQSRRLYMALVPFIKEAEIREIRPVIGTDRYDTIKELIKDDELNEDANEEYKETYDLSLAPLVHFTLAIALKRLGVELLPNSVVENYIGTELKQSKTAETNVRNGVAQKLFSDAQIEMISLESYIRSLDPAVTTEEETFDSTKPFTIF